MTQPMQMTFPFLKTTPDVGPHTFSGVSATPLKRPPQLFIDVSDDTKRLKLFRIPDRYEGYDPTNINVDDFEKLGEIPSYGLMYPDNFIAEEVPRESRSRIITLYGRQRRLTRFRDVAVDWDNHEDFRVWTTNIDTVVFINTLKELGIFDDQSIKNILEVGCGGGHITATIAHQMPWLSALYYSDILREALNCTTRNAERYIQARFVLHPMIGKGIRLVPNDLDLLICNPPYIPIAPFQHQDETDPYRGTGLIREMMEIGLDKAKRVIFSASSMADQDLSRYEKELGVRLIRHTTSEEIPLKIENVDQRWADWLVSLGLLIKKGTKDHYYPYWHTISTVEVVRE